MRILRTESSRNWGGQEERLLAESEWLVRKGHSVAVACDPESALLKHAKAFPVTCFPVRMRMSLDFLSIISLANIVRKWKPDVIHTTSPKDSWLCFALHAFGIPVVRSRNTSLPARMSATRSFIYRHGCRRVIPTAGFIADVLRIQSKVPADRIDVIGVGVDTAVFHPGVDATAFRKEFEISSEAPLFGVVAMLRREKGQMTFLHAALEILKTHPEYRFVMVGQGTGKSNIEQKLKDEIQAAFPNGNTPIILTGFRKDIPQIMASLTALVVPSIQDAQPLVIPQAFALKKTVIASRIGGIPEIVKHESTGLLVEARDEKGLAEAMIRLAENSEFRKDIEANALEYCGKELSFDRKMEQLLESYRKAINPTA